MAQAGILTEDDRVELIDGEIVEMSPVGARATRGAGRGETVAPAAFPDVVLAADDIMG